ncbi:MAG: DHA2 family efflux MFS transporter permease subunit [Burkholderiaceae bacterium]
MSATWGASEPLPTNQRLLATVALALASFMNVLDLTIVNVSVPTISGDLGVAPGQGTWAITSYAVAEAIMLPLTGWLAGRLGQVRLFCISTLMFTLTSFLCGIAPSFEALLAARVLQGVFGAAMIPMSQTLLLSCYPPEKQGFATGIWAMTTIAAPIIGPLAGGWLTDNLSWHWIFFINLPIGIVCFGLVYTLFEGRETPTRRGRIDAIGLLLLVLGIGSLQILLDKGNELDWFNHPIIVGLAITSFVSMGVFVLWEWFHPEPLVDLHLFTQRNFLVASICLFIGTIAFFGTNVVMPLWLQTQVGYTPTWAGKTMALGGILAVILGPLIGANMSKIDARGVATFGFAVFAFYAYLCSRFTPDIDYHTLANVRLIMGVGISCFFLPLITIGLSGIEPQRLAGASGLNSFIRNLGSSFGTALITSLWDHRAQLHHANLAENINYAAPAAQSFLERLSALGLNDANRLAYVNRLIDTQAYLLSTNDVLLTCGAVMICLTIPIWFARGPFLKGAPAEH